MALHQPSSNNYRAKKRVWSSTVLSRTAFNDVVGNQFPFEYMHFLIFDVITAVDICVVKTTTKRQILYMPHINVLS